MKLTILNRKRIILFFLILIEMPIALNGYCKSGFGYISGFNKELRNGDTVFLNSYRLRGFDGIPSLQTKYYSVIENHAFKFKIATGDSPRYIDVIFSKTKFNENLKYYLIKNNWDIKINYVNNNYIFTGNGSIAWNVHFQEEPIYVKHQAKYKLLPSLVGRDCAIDDSVMIDEIHYLDKFKGKIDHDVYVCLKGDFIGNNEIGKYYAVRYLFLNFKDSAQVFNKSYNSYLINEKKKINELVHVEHNQVSNLFSQGIIDNYLKDSCILKGRRFNIDKAFEFFKKYDVSKQLKEKLFAFLLYQNRTMSDDPTNCLAQATSYSNSSEINEVLEWLKRIRFKGAKAYNFKLVDSTEIIHQLEDYKNKVVILDFWFTGCGPCRTLAPLMKKIELEFEGKAVVFITVNVDNDSNKWKTSLKEENYTSRLSINLHENGFIESTIAKHYNVVQFPTIIIIDKDGTLDQNPVNPITDKGANLTELINMQLAK